MLHATAASGPHQHACPSRYYRDPRQPAPQLGPDGQPLPPGHEDAEDEAQQQQQELDPQELLRQAEEQAGIEEVCMFVYIH